MQEKLDVLFHNLFTENVLPLNQNESNLCSTHNHTSHELNLTNHYYNLTADDKNINEKTDRVSSSFTEGTTKFEDDERLENTILSNKQLHNSNNEPHSNIENKDETSNYSTPVTLTFTGIACFYLLKC